MWRFSSEPQAVTSGEPCWVTLAGATSRRQTVGLFPVFCDRKYFVQVSKGPCPWEVSPLLSNSRFLLLYLNFSGEIGGVTNYLKTIWGTCRKWGRGKKGQKLNFAWEGNLILVLLVLINQRACLCTGCAKESSCFLNIRLFWMNTASSLPVTGKRDRVIRRTETPNSYPTEDSKLCLVAFESQWEASYSFRIPNPPRNKYLVCAWLFNSLGFSKVRKTV